MAYRRRHRSRKVLVVLLLLMAVTLVALDRTVEGGPLRSVTGSLRDATSWVSRGLGVGDGPSESTSAETARLQRELDVARSQLMRTSDIDRERRDLASILGVQLPEAVPRQTARVTNVHRSNFGLYVEIDKGSANGLAPGFPVVNGQGLLGRVDSVSPRHATVQLAGDRGSNIGVRLGAAGEIGVARGTGSNDALDVGLLEPNSAVVPGDVAVTSGLSGSVFPPGLPVGTVESVSPGTAALSKKVEIVPAVDFSRIDYVAVLQWGPR